MKHLKFSIKILSILLLIFSMDSFAQRGTRWKSSGGWGTNSNYNKLYNSSTIETLKGEVVAIDKIVPEKGMSYGIHLKLKTDKETISIHLGPGWFIENQDVKIELKDKIEVKGSRITYKNKPAIIAAEIKRGNDLLKLRDENGIPIWSGWRRQ